MTTGVKKTVPLEKCTQSDLNHLRLYFFTVVMCFQLERPSNVTANNFKITFFRPKFKKKKKNPTLKESMCVSNLTLYEISFKIINSESNYF